MILRQIGIRACVALVIILNSSLIVAQPSSVDSSWESRIGDYSRTKFGSAIYRSKRTGKYCFDASKCESQISASDLLLLRHVQDLAVVKLNTELKAGESLLFVSGIESLERLAIDISQFSALGNINERQLVFQKQLIDLLFENINETNERQIVGLLRNLRVKTQGLTLLFELDPNFTGLSKFHVNVFTALTENKSLIAEDVTLKGKTSLDALEILLAEQSINSIGCAGLSNKKAGFEKRMAKWKKTFEWHYAENEFVIVRKSIPNE